MLAHYTGAWRWKCSPSVCSSIWGFALLPLLSLVPGEVNPNFLFYVLLCAVVHIGRGGQGSFIFSEYRPQESVPGEEGSLRHSVVLLTLILVFSIPNSDSWSLALDWQGHRDKLIGKPRTRSHGEEAFEMEGARFCGWREGGSGWPCGSFEARRWAGANGDPHIHRQLWSHQWQATALIVSD